MAGDRFSVVDYVVFSLMLLISAFIGVWHACRGGKQNTTEEYLLANRKMKFLPVSISILLSFLSAITLLGIPAEIYVYGAQFFMTTIAYILICIVVSTVFIPMFRRIKLTSVHEYLERRFSLGIRILTSCLFILTVVSMSRKHQRKIVIRQSTLHTYTKRFTNNVICSRPLTEKEMESSVLLKY